jgi:hypothetical protein
MCRRRGSWLSGGAGGRWSCSSPSCLFRRVQYFTSAPVVSNMKTNFQQKRFFDVLFSPSSSLVTRDFLLKTSSLPYISRSVLKVDEGMLAERSQGSCTTCVAFFVHCGNVSPYLIVTGRRTRLPCQELSRCLAVLVGGQGRQWW